LRIIDMQTWPRREHFKTFNAFDQPHFGVCANVDLTTFQPFVKQQGSSITVAIIYLITRTANAIPEFRYRIRQEAVVEHQVVHPSATLLGADDLFTFSYFEYFEDFPKFAHAAAREIAYRKSHPTLENLPDRDDVLYMTAIPWVSFTSFMHPMNQQAADSIPRFAWGKFFKEGECLKMPLGVQAHHALMDGVHLGKFYTLFQEYLQQPEAVLGNG
jgi:chloramphenicol O-acetyltransferase type A